MAAHRKPTAEKAVTITVSVSANLLDQIEQEAIRRRMTRSEYIREAIKIHLIRHEIESLTQVMEGGAANAN